MSAQDWQGEALTAYLDGVESGYATARKDGHVDAVIDIRPDPQASEVVKAAEAYRRVRMRGDTIETIEAADALAVAVLNAKEGT